MLIRMLQNYGVYEKGKVYQFQKDVGEGLITLGLGESVKHKRDELEMTATKNMKPCQVLKGGLSGH